MENRRSLSDSVKQRGRGRGDLFSRIVKNSIVSKTPVLLTNPYVKKCFSREFVFEVPLFYAQSPSEITNRKLGVLSKTGKLTYIHIVVRSLNQDSGRWSFSHFYSHPHEIFFFLGSKNHENFLSSLRPFSALLRYFLVFLRKRCTFDRKQHTQIL
ncbi:hypothetical protein M2137_001707 [Parabacteroides sp. PFB2-10]|nr:hypothetical protein [Parabacteroides sp. PFB2-10]